MISKLSLSLSFSPLSVPLSFLNFFLVTLPSLYSLFASIPLPLFSPFFLFLLYFSLSLCRSFLLAFHSSFLRVILSLIFLFLSTRVFLFLYPPHSLSFFLDFSFCLYSLSLFIFFSFPLFIFSSVFAYVFFFLFFFYPLTSSLRLLFFPPSSLFSLFPLPLFLYFLYCYIINFRVASFDLRRRTWQITPSMGGLLTTNFNRVYFNTRTPQYTALALLRFVYSLSPVT